MCYLSSKAARNLWIALWTAVGIVAAIALCNMPTAKAAPLVTSWTEPFRDLTLWRQVGQDCFRLSNGYADGICQSAALESTKKWDVRQKLTVSFTIAGEPAQGSSTDHYFSGLTIWQYEDAQHGNYYFESAVTRSVPPFTANTSNRIVGLITNRATRTVNPYTFKSPITLNQLQIIKMAWQPSPARWQVDYPGGTAWNTTIPFLYDGQAARLRFLCVSVGENTPNDGSSAHCRLGPITVTGVEV